MVTDSQFCTLEGTRATVRTNQSPKNWSRVNFNTQPIKEQHSDRTRDTIRIVLGTGDR